MKRFSAKVVIIVLMLLIAALMPQVSFGENYSYYSKGRRDPFIPLIISEARTSLGLQAVETIDDIKLEGVILDPFGKSIAVLNGEAIKEGDKAYNVEVVKISDGEVKIKIYNKPYTINLVEEGGE